MGLNETNLRMQHSEVRPNPEPRSLAGVSGVTRRSTQNPSSIVRFLNVFSARNAIKFMCFRNAFCRQEKGNQIHMCSQRFIRQEKGNQNNMFPQRYWFGKKKTIELIWFRNLLFAARKRQSSSSVFARFFQPAKCSRTNSVSQRLLFDQEKGNRIHSFSQRFPTSENTLKISRVSNIAFPQTRVH